MALVFFTVSAAGIYFAAKSAYSWNYSYRPNQTTVDERRPGQSDEREMFLAKLLIGSEVLMDRDISAAKAQECKALIVPPVNPVTGTKCNTVTGNTAGSQVSTAVVLLHTGRCTMFQPDLIDLHLRSELRAS